MQVYPRDLCPLPPHRISKVEAHDRVRHAVVPQLDRPIRRARHEHPGMEGVPPDAVFGAASSGREHLQDTFLSTDMLEATLEQEAVPSGVGEMMSMQNCL